MLVVSFSREQLLHLPKIRFPSGLSHPASRPSVVSWARGFPVRTGDIGIPRDKLADCQSQSFPLHTEPLLYFQSSDIPHLTEVFAFFVMLYTCTM